MARAIPRRSGEGCRAARRMILPHVGIRPCGFRDGLPSSGPGRLSGAAGETARRPVHDPGLHGAYRATAARARKGCRGARSGISFGRFIVIPRTAVSLPGRARLLRTRKPDISVSKAGVIDRARGRGRFTITELTLSSPAGSSDDDTREGLR
jgi:hypothetical protein